MLLPGDSMSSLTLSLYPALVQVLHAAEAAEQAMLLKLVRHDKCNSTLPERQYEMTGTTKRYL